PPPQTPPVLSSPTHNPLLNPKSSEIDDFQLEPSPPRESTSNPFYEPTSPSINYVPNPYHTNTSYPHYEQQCIEPTYSPYSSPTYDPSSPHYSPSNPSSPRKKKQPSNVEPSYSPYSSPHYSPSNPSSPRKKKQPSNVEPSYSPYSSPHYSPSNPSSPRKKKHRSEKSTPDPILPPKSAYTKHNPVLEPQTNIQQTIIQQTQNDTSSKETVVTELYNKYKPAVMEFIRTKELAKLKIELTAEITKSVQESVYNSAIEKAIAYHIYVKISNDPDLVKTIL
ncbi:unnamed protein product, partial [marine sediment metagenome]